MSSVNPAAPDGSGAGGQSADAPATLREIFAGRRGRLLIGLLATEFGAAVQGIAYSTVLPVAASELHGASLYGATLASGTLSTLFVLALGSRVLSRFQPLVTLLLATALFAAGTVLAALAPAMVWVLAGSAVRGAGSGILAGFGYSALGSLYDDRLRSRVLGLFAIMWLLPSLIGPLVNTAVTTTFGWRWAMAWPALLVVAAVVAVVGRNASTVPLESAERRVPVWIGLAVVGAVVVASVASAQKGAGATLVFAAAVAAALALAIGLFGYAAAGDRRRFAVMTAFFGTCFVYFGGESVTSLSVIDALGGTVAEGAIAIGAAGVTWSLVPFVPDAVMRRLRLGTTLPRAAAGLVVVALGIAAVALVLMLGSGPAGVWALIGAAAVIGIGMGLAYQVLSAAGFDELDAQHVPAVATATAFGETASTTLGAMLAGGIYSLAASAGIPARHALSGTFWGLAAAAVVTLAVVAAARRRTLASKA